jgi:catechol 2,3-dioxygenase-like lactoylglutathione lyase family enzyme
MKTTELVWVGIRTPDFQESVRFFRDVLGMPLNELDEEKEFAWFRLDTGQSFELFGRDDPKRQFMTAPVLGFKVEDAHEARKRMEGTGVEFITDVREARGSMS